MNAAEELASALQSFAVAVPRIAVAFAVVPLLTREVAPPIVRNGFAVALALALYPLVAEGGELEVEQHGVVLG